MLNRLMNWIVPKLARWCERHGRVLRITGRQGPDDVYLVRYFLFRSKPFSVYIHRFLRADQDDPHDHPFDFITYVVSGSYEEIQFVRCRDGRGRLLLGERTETRSRGSSAYRSATTIHRVVVPDRTTAQIDEAPLTVVIRGRWLRPWNFYRLSHRMTGPSKVPGVPGPFWRAKQVVWHEYLNVPNDESRE